MRLAGCASTGERKTGIKDKLNPKSSPSRDLDTLLSWPLVWLDHNSQGGTPEQWSVAMMLDCSTMVAFIVEELCGSFAVKNTCTVPVNGFTRIACGHYGP